MAKMVWNWTSYLLFVALAVVTVIGGAWLGKAIAGTLGMAAGMVTMVIGLLLAGVVAYWLKKKIKEML